MAMNPWSVRFDANAIFEPSGDHTGLLFVPHERMNGTSPRSISLAPGPAGSFARWIWPSFTHSTELPSGASTGFDASPTRQEAPGFATFAAHNTSSPPSGSPDGF